MGTVDIEAIVARLHKLEEENSRLKTLLSKHGISYEESKQEPTPVVSKSENKDSAMQRLSLQDLSIQCVVIDKSIVWYGNVNFFGYNNEDNNVMRICDASIASELLNVIYKDNLL